MKVLFLAEALLFVLLFLPSAKFVTVSLVSSDAGTVHNLRTLLNYTTIGAAVADPLTLDGDSILVDDGVYSEHVLVNKSVSIFGETFGNATVDGDGYGPVFHISKPGVSVSNLNIVSGGDTYQGINSAIYVNSSDNCTFDGITMRNGGGGILISQSDHCAVHDCMVVNTGFGITALGNDTLLTDNSIFDSLIGIGLASPSGSVMRRNHIINCTEGFAGFGYNDVDTTNTIDTKLIYYLVNQTGLTVNPTTFPNAASLTIVNSDHIVVEDMNLERSGNYVSFEYASDSIVRNVTATASQDSGLGPGIGVNNADNVTLSNNNVANCFFGIALSNCINSTVQRNNVYGPNFIGIALRNSTSNLILENNVTGYERCVDFANSANNTIYHNNFLNYSEPYLDDYANSWDNGLEGNFWSGFAGVDADMNGIADLPLLLNTNNFDRHPLMGSFHGSEIELSPGVVLSSGLITNSSITYFGLSAWLTTPYPPYLEPGQEFVLIELSGDAGTTGFCRVSLPRALLNDSTSLVVLFDYMPINFAILPESNSSSVYLYFNYTHSEHDVIIIPESAPMICSFLLLATIPLVVVIRRLWSRKI